MGSAGTVEKAVDLLFHLHETAEAQGVTRIGRALGIPKSSTHRLLGSLRRRGLVERDEQGRYRLGGGLIALGLGVLDREPLSAAARPVLTELADAAGETAFLVAARSGEVVVLDKVEGPGFLRAAPKVGSTVPVHATAVGKLYLAFDPDSFETSAPAWDRFTDRTCVEPEELARETALVRARGWAVSRDEWLPGLSALAVPIWSAGELRAALALAASSPRFDEIGTLPLATRLLDAGRRIEARLGGRPAPPEMLR